MPATKRSIEELLFPGASDPDLGRRLVEHARKREIEPAKLISSEELESRPDPAWFLESFIQEDSITMLYGPPKAGKTFLAVDWAHRMALGVPWITHRAIPCRVLYCSAEGNKALGRRARTLREHHNLAIPPNLMWLPGVSHLWFQGRERPVPQEALLLAIDEFKPHVVFFDTLARHSPGADIASNQDMSKVISVADDVRAGFGCSVVFIHHARKDGAEYLGATSLFGAVDTMVALTPVQRGSFRLSVLTKESEDYTPPYTFRIMGYGSSAVIEEGEPTTSAHRKEQVFQYVLENGPCTAKEVQDALFEQPGNEALNSLNLLVDEGRISPAGKKTGAGRPARLWKVPEME